jgi:hypothetical protein
VSTKADDQLPSSVMFNYIKSNYFRVVHADGAMGGFTPRGQLFFSLYSERAPLPDVTVQAIEGGQLGKEITEKREGSAGIARELEVGVVMDIAVAKSLRDWLNERIKIFEQLQPDSAVTLRKESEVKT